LSDLSVIVELNPGIDRHWDEDSECRRVEGYYRRGTGDVVVRGELSNAIRDWNTDEADMCRICEEAEDVLAVEFIAIKGTSYVHSALHLVMMSPFYLHDQKRM
jgi:hypothetical protein